MLVNKILQKQPLVVARIRDIFHSGSPEGQQEAEATSTEQPSAASPVSNGDVSEDQSPEGSTGAYCSNFPTALMCRDAGLNLADSDEPRHPRGAAPTTRNEVFFISGSSSDVSQDPAQSSYMLSAFEDPVHRPKAVQRQRSLLERIGSWFQAPKLERSQSVPNGEERHTRKLPPLGPEALQQSEGWSEVHLPPVAQEHVSEEDRTTGDEGFSSEVETHTHTLTPGQSPIHDHRSPDSDLMVSPQGDPDVHKCACGKGDLCDSWTCGDVTVEN